MAERPGIPTTPSFPRKRESIFAFGCYDNFPETPSSMTENSSKVFLEGMAMMALEPDLPRVVRETLATVSQALHLQTCGLYAVTVNQTGLDQAVRSSACITRT